MNDWMIEWMNEKWWVSISGKFAGRSENTPKGRIQRIKVFTSLRNNYARVMPVPATVLAVFSIQEPGQFYMEWRQFHTESK